MTVHFALLLLTCTLQPLPPSRIAVVGGGLAGLGTAAHLLLETEQPLQALHVFDAMPPGKGGASAVAAGLLHPFTPRSKEMYAR